MFFDGTCNDEETFRRNGVPHQLRYMSCLSFPKSYSRVAMMQSGQEPRRF